MFKHTNTNSVHFLHNILKLVYIQPFEDVISCTNWDSSIRSSNDAHRAPLTVLFLFSVHLGHYFNI